MQLLLIRHALPLRSVVGQGSDPELSGIGFKQARRLPVALQRYPISRPVSSRSGERAGPPRRRRRARPLRIRLPIEDIRAENPQEWARIAAGHLPSGVEEMAFRSRVAAAVDDAVAAAGHDDTVAVFSHGGVINVVLHEILGTTRLLSFPLDYASITRLLYAHSGRASVVAVNGTEHVWDLLPRNKR
ncbi:MAG TPA: histidine phosphatase family protein [Mycobacterium sp.]|nr:histidine phosphatase family protein [Mycobacterium sp.]